MRLLLCAAADAGGPAIEPPTSWRARAAYKLGAPRAFANAAHACASAACTAGCCLPQPAAELGDAHFNNEKMVYHQLDAISHHTKKAPTEATQTPAGAKIN